MKLIEPSVEIWKQEPGIEGMYKHIERCARICYKSENKGNVTSEQFVKSLIKRKHLRPLEFGTIILSDRYCHPFFERKIAGNIVTNLRRLVELYPNDWEIFLKKAMWDKINDYRPTIHWNISRGIADEFRTHVSISSLMESTRYCNYSKDKFGGEITFVKPTWVNIPSELAEGTKLEDGPYGWCNPNYIHIYCKDIKSKWFMKACLEAEYSYLHVINEQNATPQEAREMLPLCIATNLVQCSFKDNWINFFNQRCNIDAHPDAQLIANKAKELLKF